MTTQDRGGVLESRAKLLLLLVTIILGYQFLPQWALLLMLVVIIILG